MNNYETAVAVAAVTSAAFSVAFFWFAYQVAAVIRLLDRRNEIEAERNRNLIQQRLDQDCHNRFLRKIYSAPEPPASQGGGL